MGQGKKPQVYRQKRQRFRNTRGLEGGRSGLSSRGTVLSPSMVGSNVSVSDETVPDKSGTQTKELSKVETTLLLEGSRVLARSEEQRWDKEDLMYMDLERWVEFGEGRSEDDGSGYERSTHP